MTKREMLGELRELKRMARDLEQRIDRLIEGIEAEPRDGCVGMIDQRDSNLGPKRHCAIVRRRIDEDKPGALIIGRRHLLSPEAYAEESGLRFRPVAKAHTGNDADEEAAYRALLVRMGR